LTKLTIKSRERTPRVFEVALVGRLDTETCRQLEATVALLLDGKAKEIELNLAELDYISSAGLGVVFDTMHKIKKADGRFAVTNPKPHVKKIFEITKLLPAEKVFTNAAEADRYFDVIQRREKDKDRDH
jgi:anti-anti-sigma factor